MEFDTFTATLLEARPDAPKLDEKEANRLQDAHLAYLATLHDRGYLQAAGPIMSPPGSSFRGLSLHRLPPDEVRTLFEMDPAVRAGRLSVRIFTWAVPRGAVVFSQVRFPRSQSEV